MAENETDHDRFEIREQVTQDEMHRHESRSATDHEPPSNDDFERFFRMLKAENLGEDWRSEAATHEIGVRDPIEQMTDEILATDRNRSTGWFAMRKPTKEERTAAGGIRAFSALSNGIKTYLMSEGLPDPFQLCLTDGTNWAALPMDWDQMTAEERATVARGKSVDLGWAFARSNSIPLTDVWFAAEIAMRLFDLENTSGPRREQIACQIGKLRTQQRSRRHLPDVRRGQKAKKNAKKGGEANSRRNADLRNKVVAKMEALIKAKHTDRGAADIVLRQGLGRSIDSNLGFWKRSQAKLSKR